MNTLPIASKSDLDAIITSRINQNDECEGDIEKAEFSGLPYCTLNFERKISGRFESDESDKVRVIILPLAHKFLAEKDCYIRIRVQSDLVTVHNLVISE